MVRERRKERMEPIDQRRVKRPMAQRLRYTRWENLEA